MANKCLILMILSWVLVGLCEGQGGGGGGGGGGGMGGMGDEPPCMKNLLPCTLYFHRNAAPPSLCCNPVKQLVSSDLKCYCDVFSNPLVMVSLNVTQGDAISLAKRCGTNNDADMCKNAGNENSAPPPNGSPAPPNSGGHHNNNSTTGSSGGTPPKSAASSLSKFGASSSIIVIFYFVLSLL